METMNTPPQETPCCSTLNCCSDKKKCLLCGIVAIFVLLLVAGLTFFIGKQLGLKQVPLCSPCPTVCERCGQALNQPSSIASPSADPTAGWKTYTNSKFGFSLKHPNAWFINESSSTIFITEKKIEIPPTHGLTSLTGMQINITKEPFEIPKYPWKNSLFPIKIGGLIATKMIDEEPDYSTELMYSRVLFEKNGSTYSIIFSNTDNKGKHNLIYDQILSTFKFLE